MAFGVFQLSLSDCWEPGLVPALQQVCSQPGEQVRAGQPLDELQVSLPLVSYLQPSWIVTCSFSRLHELAHAREMRPVLLTRLVRPMTLHQGALHCLLPRKASRLLV